LRGLNQGPVDEQTSSLPYASSLCGACFEVCPVRIDIPEVLVHLRAKVVEHKHALPPREEATAMRLLGWTFGGRRRLGLAERSAALGARVIGRGGRIGHIWAPGMIGAWFRKRDLKAPPRESFRRWWARSGRDES
jgi:L-lactate dehydrogenase complex protein LldF